jgi:hypothetical protein
MNREVAAAAPNSHPRAVFPHARAIEVHRPYLNAETKRRYGAWFCAIGLGILTGCASVSRHQFAEPTSDWQSRSGQLLYRTPSTTLIGDVLVRFSNKGDFELTFSKGPGVTLFVLREDPSFAQIGGAMAGPGWSGPIERAPEKLRGWLGLRDQLIRSQNRKSVRYLVGSETFFFRF